MAKLIELVEAAKILGISPEELNDMRSRSEIFGYRDGSSWKFKEEEINRVRDSKGLTGDAAPTAADDDASSEFDLDLSDDEVIDANSDFDIDLGDDDADVIALPQGDDSDSILVSEEELGKSDENTASTIIGEADELMMDESSVSKADSDALTGESGLELTLESSDINSPSDVLGDAGEKPATASDTANLGIGGSDLKVATDSGAIDLSAESGIDDGGPVEASDDVKLKSIRVVKLRSERRRCFHAPSARVRYFRVHDGFIHIPRDTRSLLELHIVRSTPAAVVPSTCNAVVIYDTIQGDATEPFWALKAW